MSLQAETFTCNSHIRCSRVDKEQYWIREGNNHFTLAEIAEKGFFLLCQVVRLFSVYSAHLSFSSAPFRKRVKSQPAIEWQRSCWLRWEENFIYSPGKPPWRPTLHRSSSVNENIFCVAWSSGKRGSIRKGSLRWRGPALGNIQIALLLTVSPALRMKRSFKWQKNKIRADLNMVQVKSVHCNKNSYLKSAECVWIFAESFNKSITSPSPYLPACRDGSTWNNCLVTNNSQRLLRTLVFSLLLFSLHCLLPSTQLNSYCTNAEKPSLPNGSEQNRVNNHLIPETITY